MPLRWRSQSAHAAWRKQVVVNKHPFRRLQKGEVSEVFAPFSSLLVLRRKTRWCGLDFRARSPVAAR